MAIDPVETQEEVGAPEGVVQRTANPALDRVTRNLAIVAAFGLVTVLAATAFLVYAATQTQDAPRTAAERVLFQLEAEVESYPDSVGPWTAYARALIAADQLSQAEDVLDDAEDFVGQAPYFDVERARLFFVRGSSADALDLLGEATDQILEVRDKELADLAERGITMMTSSVDNDLVVAQLLASEIHADAGDLSAQIEALDVALEFSPEMADITVVRGDAHAELGHTDEARADYEAALELIPDYEPALAGLAAIGE